MNITETLQLLTTLILVSGPEIPRQQATGFYFREMAPPREQAGEAPQWRAMTDLWLVTNRHVLLPKVDGSETVPEELTFHLRRHVGDSYEWVPVRLSKEEIRKRGKVHNDENIDVAILSILDLMTEKAMSVEGLLQFSSVSEENFAGERRITVETADDVVVAGYPRGFYDDRNLHPIVKAGIVASRWGANFRGQRFFLIDARLFPGSSGSIVISKPQDLIVSQGQIFRAEEKQFAFLGVYAGEPFGRDEPVELEDMVIVQKLRYDVGVVWYADLIPEIISSGVGLPK